jgi:hypothetical protein
MLLIITKMAYNCYLNIPISDSSNLHSRKNQRHLSIWITIKETDGTSLGNGEFSDNTIRIITFTQYTHLKIYYT